MTTGTHLKKISFNSSSTAKIMKKISLEQNMLYIIVKITL